MKINYSKWPSYTNKEIIDVCRVLKSNKVNYLVGGKGRLLEKKFKEKINLNFTCLVSNGTIGIELALSTLNLKENDEVIVTPRSYISSVSPVLKVGAKPIFADIDNDFNLDPKSIEDKITNKTKAIICVHLYGNPCKIEEILKIKRKYNLFLIEDCSQAHGAKINNRYVGSFGDMSIWSFCNDKIISSGGEGGIIGCKSKKFHDLLWSLKDIGKNLNKYTQKKNSYLFPYLHDNLGTNARMTEMQSVIALSHLSKLNKFIKKRNSNARILNKYLSNIKSINTPTVDKSNTHAFYRYVVTLNFEYIKKNNNVIKIIKIIHKKNIYCNVGGCPEIYKEKIFRKNNLSLKLYKAKYLSDKTISFLVDHTISEKSLHIIGKKLQKIFKDISI